jgi:hypothetical protein
METFATYDLLIDTHSKIKSTPVVGDLYAAEGRLYVWSSLNDGTFIDQGPITDTTTEE